VIQEEVDRRTVTWRTHPVRVMPSVNGPDAAAIGAAALVLQSELTHGRTRTEEGRGAGSHARPVVAVAGD
jgi:hypothetical protein